LASRSVPATCRCSSAEVAAGFPTRYLTCKFCDADIVPPGLGFITAMANFPADDCLPVAVSFDEETKVVASGAPARRTCAPLTNPPPFTVIAPGSAGTVAGTIEESTGSGFCNVTALLPVALESTELTARTITRLELGMTDGEVYTPAALIVPVMELPPVSPFTC